MKDPGGVRQANLSRLLRLVHTEGALSRAQLTDATGLNRSTIADLIGELVKRGLVAERAPHTSRRVGRPSPIVSAEASVAALTANPEVDALSMAAIGLDRSVLCTARHEVDRLLTPEETARIVADQYTRWADEPLRGVQVVGLGVAVPGLVRSSDGLVRNAPHLHWRDAPLSDLLHEATGLDVTIGNDATLGVVAEHLFGAGRGAEHVVYLNGGASGIGGGLIVHGMPVTGAGGYAGEFGQNLPHTVGSVGAVGSSAGVAGRPSGTLESEVSRARLLEVAQLASADDETLASALRRAGSPYAADDESVQEEMARQRRVLSRALARAVNVLNPSVVILGGFLAILAEDHLAELAALVRSAAMPESCEHLEIRTAQLREMRLHIGAAEAAFAALLADPSLVG